MISDDEFLKDPEIPGPTKEEIRCQVICKSEVTSDDVVADIGCGTGGLTLEFAKRARKVYAVDKNPDALKITELNLKKYCIISNVELLCGEAPKIFDELPLLDLIMVGGSSGNLPSILKKGYEKLNRYGRIIVTSILLETRVEAIQTLISLGLNPSVVEISVSRGKITGRGTMMRSLNPITVISAKTYK